MKIQVFEIGNEKNKILLIDDFHPNPEEIIEFANSLAPFPEDKKSNYPGTRTNFSELNPYMQYIINLVAPIVFQIYGFKLIPETGGFSLVTTPREDLNMFQRIPHFDQDSPLYFALVHYLFKTDLGGTSFYRHKETGIECISESKKENYISILKKQILRSGAPKPDYINDNNDIFERIHKIEPKFNRMIFYSGAILHSGDIGADFEFSNNPLNGRLTGNVFFNVSL